MRAYKMNLAHLSRINHQKKVAMLFSSIVKIMGNIGGEGNAISFLQNPLFHIQRILQAPFHHCDMFHCFGKMRGDVAEVLMVNL